MTDTPRILVIGYCYPPTASPEAFVSAKLMRNIPDCKIDVLTLEDGLVSDFFDDEMGEYAADINGEVIKVSPSPLTKYLCRVPRLPLRPDRWLLANSSVHQRAKQLMPRKYDLLITRSQYHSAHLVGLRLKKSNPALPWIACFSDPWSESDHQPFIPFISHLSQKHEEKVMELADRLIFPTTGLLEHMTKGHNAAVKKSYVVPHCIDYNLYPREAHPATSLKDESQYVWRIFGSFYGNRQPDVLFEALSKISIPSNKNLSVEVFGSHHEKYDNFDAFNQEHTDRKIRYAGQISHKKALSLMQVSDLLIVIDSTNMKESFYLPSKIIDYFGSGAHVLSICREGTVSAITRERGHLVASIDSVTAICVEMEKALSMRHPRCRQQCISSDFSASTVGQTFRKIITDAIKR
ncbi:MAG: hypothetical protein ACMZ66_15605 [Thalassospira sp.]|uniref:hypothetical protein n=1 Tax=Thalassospira sp. TaxID=1912094 RepID=UPI003A86FC00